MIPIRYTLCSMTSDVKFHDFFGVKYFVKNVVNKNFHDVFFGQWGAGCIVHCNKVSKPVKGKYPLSCMNSIMYFFLLSERQHVNIL